jgi:hypothetical protein
MQSCGLIYQIAGVDVGYSVEIHAGMRPLSSFLLLFPLCIECLSMHYNLDLSTQRGESNIGRRMLVKNALDLMSNGFNSATSELHMSVRHSRMVRKYVQNLRQMPMSST